MSGDTDIGGPQRGFPQTRRSIVRGAASADDAERERAWHVLVEAYWKPVYKYVRLRWRRSNEDAKDLTQGFFARALEKEFFRSYDPSRARFRTYLKSCLEAYLTNEDKARHAKKRGGERLPVSLDFETAEQELARSPGAPGDLDEYFHNEWVRAVFAAAVGALESEYREAGRDVRFELFRRYDLERTASPARVTYDDLAAEHGLQVTTVTNWLAAARRDFRRLVLDRLRQLTASDAEFAEEVRAVLGVDPP